MRPKSALLSSRIIDGMDFHQVVYAEVTPAGAMGNSGGILIYVEESGALTKYEVNVYHDSEAYFRAEEALFKHVRIPGDEDGSTKNELLFDYFWGGMGNNVLVNKYAALEVEADSFSIQKNGTRHLIHPSCSGVFESVARELQRRKASPRPDPGPSEE